MSKRSLESLEVGATPLVRHFLNRLDLPTLFDRHLPTLPGRQSAVPSSLVLTALITNLLLGRQPLYAIPAWVARRVPEHLGLQQDQVAVLTDDHLGRSLYHLFRADRATLLTDLVLHVVREFAIERKEFHQDTTTVTAAGEYANQPPPDKPGRPVRITHGYNKDHRPDLKQLVYGITVSADGAVPVHCKICDGNTADDTVHKDTWDFLCKVAGSADFLYVADSKLCSRENMGHIASGHGRFLTVMPKTRSEDGWFREYIQTHPVEWACVRREPNPRRRALPDIVYHAVEAPRRSSEGYRVLWYRSSQKQEQDRADRQRRLERAFARLDGSQAPGRLREFGTPGEAREAARRITEEEGVVHLVRIEVDHRVEEDYRQVGPGRPGPKTEYRQIEIHYYRVRLVEDGKALKREALCDGLFPLITNDESLSVAEALGKYKYQPFVEKRHEQMKSVFAVMPVWLKNVDRVEALLWLYYVVQLVQALVEREVRRRMKEDKMKELGLYPEGRGCEAPTAEVVFNVLEGHRRHRLLNEHGQEVQRFYDELTQPAQQMLRLLGVDLEPYGITG